MNENNYKEILKKNFSPESHVLSWNVVQQWQLSFEMKMFKSFWKEGAELDHALTEILV